MTGAEAAGISAVIICASARPDGTIAATRNGSATHARKKELMSDIAVPRPRSGVFLSVLILESETHPGRSLAEQSRRLMDTSISVGPVKAAGLRPIAVTAHDSAR